MSEQGDQGVGDFEGFRLKVPVEADVTEAERALDQLVARFRGQFDSALDDIARRIGQIQPPQAQQGPGGPQGPPLPPLDLGAPSGPSEASGREESNQTRRLIDEMRSLRGSIDGLAEVIGSMAPPGGGEL